MRSFILRQIGVLIQSASQFLACYIGMELRLLVFKFIFEQIIPKVFLMLMMIPIKIDPMWLVRAHHGGQPDILIIAQQVTGSGDANIKVFYVDHGTLYLIYCQNKYGDIFKNTNTSGGRAVGSLDFMTFKTYGWARSMEYTGGLETTWKFDAWYLRTRFY